VTETSIDWTDLVARAPDGVVCANEERRIVWANHAAERMLGCAPGELEGALLGDVIELGPGESERGGRLAGFDAPERASGRRKDGSLVPLEVSLTAHEAHGKILMIAAVMRDLSANDRALAAELLAAERESFLSMAAHQLRAPIQPILNSLRTIERALATGKTPPQDTMSRAMRQALRLGRLVDAILSDAAAIERGTLEVHAAPFDLAAFTRDICEDFRVAALNERLEYRGPSCGVLVVSDEDRVHQILIGLIDNALKYSSRKRAVVVEVEATDVRARVRVIDEGIGIPLAEQARVFGKFYRGSNVPTAASGLGVGLYLARALAQRLHGSLSVTSEVGHGSAFSLVLPRQWPEAERGAATPARRGGEGHVRSPS
jgi:PAS domain S-box-containing protein